jgi:hypothetical protein
VRLRCRRLLRRVLFIGGLHGQFTFRTKNGIRTLAFERGTVESVGSGAVTVRAADGTQWTWHLVPDTVVREGGNRASQSAVTDGAQVFVGGPVVSGADDARLIIVRSGQKAPAPGSS